MIICASCGALTPMGEPCSNCGRANFRAPRTVKTPIALGPVVDDSKDPPPGPSVFVSPNLASAWAHAATHDLDEDAPVDAPAPAAAPEVGSVGSDAGSDARSGRAPWEIELRDPVPEPRPVTIAELGIADRRRVPFGALVAVGCVIALLGGMWLQRSGGTDGDSVAADETQTTIGPGTATTASDDVVEVAGDRAIRDDAEPGSTSFTFAPREGADDGPSTTGPDSTPDAPATADAGTASTTATTDASTTTVVTTTTTTVATTTTAEPADVEQPDVPMLAASFTGGWVAQLSSVSKSAGAARAENAHATVAADVGDVVVADSSEWAVLADGYWVIVSTGPFGSSDDVQDWCDAVERSAADCIPRQLSGRR